MVAKTATKKKTEDSKTVSPFERIDPFPLQVIRKDWDDVDTLNDKIREKIWRMRALDPDCLYRSNTAGTWHSQDNMITALGDEGVTLRDMFAQTMLQWGSCLGLQPGLDVRLTQAAWGMVYSDGGYATVHTHPNCHVSAVYYVDDTTTSQEKIMATGVKLRSGDIEFIHPHPHGMSCKVAQLSPMFVQSFKRGRMLAFPSHLAHFVHPIVGAGERISIACNGNFFPVEKAKT